MSFLFSSPIFSSIYIYHSSYLSVVFHSGAVSQKRWRGALWPNATLRLVARSTPLGAKGCPFPKFRGVLRIPTDKDAVIWPMRFGQRLNKGKAEKLRSVGVAPIGKGPLWDVKETGA